MAGQFWVKSRSLFQKLASLFAAAFLVTEKPAKLVESLGFVRVNFQRAAEALFGFGGEAALNIYQAELIMGVGIVRVDGGQFELAFEVLTLPESAADIAEIAAETLVNHVEHPG